jgi:hypothetical protein
MISCSTQPVRIAIGAWGSVRPSLPEAEHALASAEHAYCTIKRRDVLKAKRQGTHKSATVKNLP